MGLVRCLQDIHRPATGFSPGKRRMERYLKRIFWALTTGAGVLLLNGIAILSGIIPAGG